ncbi:MAG: trypsin-like peptidase domain-containing protein [Acidimicrobiales bacterium]
MDNFNQHQTNQAGYQATGPDPRFTIPQTNVTTGRAGKGRSRFLGALATLALAAGTGVGGYTAAGAMLGGADESGIETTTVAPSDEPPSDGTPTGENSGSDGSDTIDSEVVPGDEPIPADDQAPPSGTPVPGAAMTVEQANASVIRIEATGEFADPEFGFIEGVGSGSGFIISNDGVAVTNNHVVAGAAFLEVFVPGEDRPRNARILATSECSDLAVIDIEGGGFPTVALNMTAPTIGTDVYAAGYPLGDPEFTLTKGIVSKARTRGDTPLSSVDGVLEHDARINPGNSGGPLFDQFGQVVGVNYQGNPATEQSFAITAADALPIIDQLSAGVFVDSIGVNGQIVDLGDRYGLFVSSVETGSMADRVGLVPGDVILELENVAVSTDGTMGAYCDVLRTNGIDVPLDITVLRPELDRLLFGTLNSDEILTGFDAAEMMSNAGMDGSTAGGNPVADYQRVTDDSGTVSVDVPTAWTEVATGALGTMDDLANVSASTDLTSFENDWVVGGLQLTAFDSSRYDFPQIWDARNQLLDECGTVEAVEDVVLGEYEGLLRVGHECGPRGGASLLLFQVESPESAHFGSGIVQIISPADVDAAERALATVTIR